MRRGASVGYRNMTPEQRAAYMREWRKNNPAPSWTTADIKDRSKPRGVAGSAYVAEDWAAYMRRYMRWKRDISATAKG